MTEAKRPRRRIKTSEDINDTPQEVNEKVAAIANMEYTEEDAIPLGRTDKTKTSSYEREFRLRLLHRMLMRQIPLNKIAEELKVSVDTVIKDRFELYKRLREQASDINLNELVGGTMGFYNEIQGMALRTASNTKTPMAVRMQALRTALSAKNDNHRFLQAAGVFDVLRFQSGEDQVGGSDIEKLVNLTERMMADDEETDSLAEDFGVDELEIEVEKEDDTFDLRQHQKLF
jgi:hypothetical protein